MLGAPECDKFSEFQENIVNPLANPFRYAEGLANLKKLTLNYILRRTKTQKLNGKPIVTLPEMKTQVLEVILPPGHRLFYDSIFKSNRSEFQSIARLGDCELKKEYIFFIELVLFLSLLFF
jgi:hypothetical protein